MSEYKIINDNGNGVYEVEFENSNIHYYVNENKKTVAAVMRECRTRAEREFIKTIIFITEFGFYYPELLKKFSENMKETYRGKAHCIGGDEFNLKTGMKIAREHMLADYYKDYYCAHVIASQSFYNITLRLDKINDNLMRRAMKFIELSEAYKESAINHIKKSN